MVLVTATPHSGNEQAFRALLGLLDDEFENLPTEIELDTRESLRKKLALHLVQRRRADIRHFLDTDTSFPKRLDKEETYAFSPEYRKLFNDIIQFAREFVTTGDQQRRARRVRYWSALALLRCVSSSPAAAVATLRSRAAVDEAQTRKRPTKSAAAPCWIRMTLTIPPRSTSAPAPMPSEDSADSYPPQTARFCAPCRGTGRQIRPQAHRSHPARQSPARRRLPAHRLLPFH